MSEPVTVLVSSRNQIQVPRIARERLNIQSGDRLLVDVQDGVIVLLPQPASFTEKLAGLHADLWQEVDTNAYLQEERNAWDDSTSD